MPTNLAAIDAGVANGALRRGRGVGVARLAPAAAADVEAGHRGGEEEEERGEEPESHHSYEGRASYLPLPRLQINFTISGKVKMEKGL